MGHSDADHDPREGVWRGAAARLRDLIKDARKFFTEISGTRDAYYVSDLESQLRETIVARITDVLAASDVAFLDMARNQAALAAKVAEATQPSFAALGLELNQFTVENVSLPDELTKVMDQRIGVQMAGNLGSFTQFQTAEALGVAAANPGGAAGAGVGVGAGVAMGQAMMNGVTQGAAAGANAGSGAQTERFCIWCGKPMPRTAKFCPECGRQQ
jgi:membrane protease subunit (stomatin/prohibitin family)